MVTPARLSFFQLIANRPVPRSTRVAGSGEGASTFELYPRLISRLFEFND
jgi:hypothetical protein